MAVISSPCIGTCTIDPETGQCRGCHRTRAEIAAWTGLSEPQRLAIMRTLVYRRPDAANGQGRDSPAGGRE